MTVATTAQAAARASPRAILSDPKPAGIGRHHAYRFRGGRDILKRDPEVRPFSIRVRALSLAEVMPFVGAINDGDFEGRPAETVMLMGPNKRPRGHFADLLFLERPISFNKFRNPETGAWDHLFNAETGKLFRPYRLVDFTSLAAQRLPAR